MLIFVMKNPRYKTRTRENNKNFLKMLFLKGTFYYLGKDSQGEEKKGI